MVTPRARGALPAAARGRPRRGGGRLRGRGPRALRRVALKVYHRPDRDRAQLLHEARVAVAARGPGRRPRLRRRPRARAGSRWSGRRSARSARCSASGDVGAASPIERWALPLASALARVHAAGWVHHDVKPANVLLRGSGRPAARRLRHRAARGRAEPPGQPRLRVARAPRRARQRPADDVYGFGRVLEDALDARLPERRRRGARDAPRGALAAACRAPGEARPRDGAQLSLRIDARRSLRPQVDGRARRQNRRYIPPETHAHDVHRPHRRRPQAHEGSLARGAQAPPRSQGEDDAASTCARRTSGAAATSPAPSRIPRGFLEIQAEQKLPDKNAHIVAYCAGGTRSALAAATLAGARLHERRDGEPRLRALEGPRLPDGAAAAAHRRAARALLAPHPPARGGRGGSGEAPQEQGAPARRGRPRLAGGAVPRRGGRRDARDRRRRRGRRVEPPAADHPRHEPRRARRRSRARRRRSRSSTRT